MKLPEIADDERMRAALSLWQYAGEHVIITANIVSRARLFHENGIEIHFMHSILAYAGAVFLTTDTMVPFTEYTVPVADHVPRSRVICPTRSGGRTGTEIHYHREWRHQGPEMISRSADAPCT